MAKIKRLVVKNLNNWGEKGNFDLTFHDDLNIFTGQNGSGKTTLMKLMWYVLSGNVIFTNDHIYFDFAELELVTEKEEKFIFEFRKEFHRYEVHLTRNSKRELYDKDFNYGVIHNLSKRFKSCFFPTFRRLEGGFRPKTGSSHQKQLIELLQSFANELSQFSNVFVTSFSTHDLKTLITTNYAILLEKGEASRQEITQEFITKTTNLEANATIPAVEVKKMLENGERQKANIMRPYTELTKLIEQFFKEKNISIQQDAMLGSIDNKLDINLLSAGEKQMLSFLAYNAFLNDGIIFIDEPEMSLHPNWQRKLIPMLMEQNDSNQLFFATHSPFFYAHYPSKEHILDENKGDKA